MLTRNISSTFIWNPKSIHYSEKRQKRNRIYYNEEMGKALLIPFLNSDNLKSDTVFSLVVYDCFIPHLLFWFKPPMGNQAVYDANHVNVRFILSSWVLPLRLLLMLS